ncbi:uncharacterized protein N7473_004314 [Penicillium subrubescens]|uniref:uncharacterized protein n=1 Tax=Penicillium subrubescens TaxID=1316194 RepID=UPI002544FA4A|nr:uncharacterized protein N7473_004314 [Penicillium subrubescens]KAJ5900244.1 hypothetical protein N7473_004314 [Penicillium subrubescens]
MEELRSCISTAIHFLSLAKSEPWDAFHIRQQDEEGLVMEATGWRLNIPLEEMKGSLIGISFLLDSGGYFWCILLHALQHCCDTEWQPIRGSDGLRVVNRSQNGKLWLCELEYGDVHSTIPFTLLKKTSPGRLMISQAESTGGNVDQSTVQIFLTLLKNASIGNSKYFWRWILAICILGLQCMLWIIVTVHTQTGGVICYRYQAEEFEQLD